MLKKLYKEKPFKFNFDKKEAYSFEDVQELLTQNANAVVAYYDAPIENDFNNLLSEKEKEIENAKLLKQELDKQSLSLEEITKTKTNMETQIAEFTKELEPIRAERKAKVANELLSGLVVKGAEVDTYDLLNDKIKEIKFEEKETIEEKHAKIKPIVETLFTTKPYLKPIVEVQEVEEKFDDNEIIVKKEGEKEESTFVPSLNYLPYD